MTLSPVRLALASLLICVLLPGGRGGARAEDPSPTTAAEQAFKDAWWAETGGGNLNEALALYEKAAAAEGPAPVRAKALYRRAIVLQRIGRTEEAIKTLERLAKEHPGETSLQSDARARLEEWTAIDLRTGFPEWYRRFQYGPEFQAKVLDLVLKLAAPTQEVQNAAELELVTIGEPSVGALKAHLASRNWTLRGRALQVLLKLGVVPDEITDQLVWWTGDPSIWGTILDLPPERRTALLKRMGSEDTTDAHAVLRAGLGGLGAVLEHLKARQPQGDSSAFNQLLMAAMKRVPSEGPLHEQARALMRSGVPDPSLWVTLAWHFHEQGYLTREDLEAWDRAGLSVSDGMRLRLALDARLVEAGDGLRMLRDLVARPGMASDLLKGVVTLLPRLPWPQSRDDVGQLLRRIWPQLNNHTFYLKDPNPRLAESFARAAELETDAASTYNLLVAWLHLVRGSEESTDDALTRWMTRDVGAVMQDAAIRAAMERVRVWSAERVLTLLEASSPRAQGRVALWKSLLGLPAVAQAVWSHAGGLTRLVAAIRAVEDHDPRLMEALGDRLLRAAEAPLLAEAVAREWLRAPTAFPNALIVAMTQSLRRALNSQGAIDSLRAEFVARWRGATADEREKLLQGVRLIEPTERDRASLDDFWRQQLRTRPPVIPRNWQSYVLSQLSTLTLDDLKSVYDFSVPAQADEASLSVAAESQAGSSPPRVSPSREVFRALRLALRPDGPSSLHLARQLITIPEVVDDLLPLLLASEFEHVRSLALNRLIERSRPTDQEHWIRLLSDREHSIRAQAARSLVRVPTPVTLKALVAALDDPHPDVRAAALESLDAIQKMEELKARWREKVK